MPKTIFVPTNYCKSMWFPIIMLGWGIIMTLTGLVRDFNGLVIARVFLGIAESGLFPVSLVPVKTFRTS